MKSLLAWVFLWAAVAAHEGTSRIDMTKSTASIIHGYKEIRSFITKSCAPMNVVRNLRPPSKKRNKHTNICIFGDATLYEKPSC